eukprot:CAMPEP_0176339628 /NCGR_PEP_ID=MMETSP0126-20121128/927_1 /TAXON_ID=141414 ORGANISM="Strombidinopsis acuminatum, Strain SPMC142" /NCGR_SAMPLE_ID=MMETSP0126 /ASSEMBLY_ACC=CAM_ASM_000229 /LENGTH=114 /DNA_ID=CAMNT_0017683353 /DNA_START=765 /DNA_END=1109 /DNA_ORIENTATION=-
MLNKIRGQRRGANRASDDNNLKVNIEGIIPNAVARYGTNKVQSSPYANQMGSLTDEISSSSKSFSLDNDNDHNTKTQLQFDIKPMHDVPARVQNKSALDKTTNSKSEMGGGLKD